MQPLHMASTAARSDGRLMLPTFPAPPVFCLHYQARWAALAIAVGSIPGYQVASTFQGRHIGLSERLQPLREPFSCGASGGLPLRNRANAIRTHKTTAADRYGQELAFADKLVRLGASDAERCSRVFD